MGRPCTRPDHPAARVDTGPLGLPQKLDSLFDLGFIGPFLPSAVSRELRVTLDELPSLSGLVLSGNGPVSGASVSLRQVTQDHVIVNGFQSLEAFKDVEQVTSDATGFFLLTPRSPGEFVIRTEAPGYAPAVWGPVQIEREVGRKDIELVMGQGGSIAGRLILTGGAHSAGRAIGASRGDGKPLGTQTDAEGEYRFDEGPLPTDEVPAVASQIAAARSAAIMPKTKTSGLSAIGVGSIMPLRIVLVT